VITAHGPFEGLDRFEARPAVVAALRADGRVVSEKRPYPHAVGHCSRCDTVVEPRLSLQWFVKVEPLAKAAGQVTFSDWPDRLQSVTANTQEKLRLTRSDMRDPGEETIFAGQLLPRPRRCERELGSGLAT